MGELSPAGIDIAVLVVAALLYAFIWLASRNLSRLAKILSRVAPLGLIIPLMIYLSVYPAGRQPSFATREAAPPAGYGGAPRNGGADATAKRAEEEQQAAAAKQAEAATGGC